MFGYLRCALLHDEIVLIAHLLEEKLVVFKILHQRNWP